MDKYIQFCIEDAEWYAQKSKDAMEASRTDPESYFKESQESAKILCQVLPIIISKSLDPSYKVPSFRNHWSGISVSLLDILKGIIGIGSKLTQNIRQLPSFAGLLYKLTENISTRM